MRLRFALLVVVVACAGCTRHAFLDERRTEPFAGLLERGAALEREVERVPAAPPGEESLAIAVEYVRSAQEPARRLLVFVGGVFSSRGTWRLLVGPLGEEHDLLLLDPPGCGASDKPDPEGPASGRYTPAWMAGHELRALGAWRSARRDERPVTLIGHSMGSASCLRMVADPALAGDAPRLVEAIDSVVLVSAPDVAVATASPSLRLAATVTDFQIGAARALGVFCPLMANAAWSIHYAPERTALGSDFLGLAGAVAGRSTRRASQAMLARYNPSRPDGSLDHARVLALRRDLENVRIPILVVHGADDRTVPVANGRRLAEGLPNGRFLPVPRARHSVHGEQAPRVAAAILAFLREVDSR